MRALWSGTLSFGLINIPVRLYSGVEAEHGIELKMLHNRDLSPIRYARICIEDGQEIPYEDIVKGYEYQPGEYVVLTEEELERANVAKSNTIDIKHFAKEPEIDIRYFEKPYYLEPAKGADKPYALLREALARSKSVAICTFVLRTREHLAAVKPVGAALVLEQMRFADEIAESAGLRLPFESEVSEKEMDMAVKLIEQLTESFDPSQFHDTYREDLKELIQSKIEGKKSPGKGTRPVTTPSKDLMEVLKASLEKAEAKSKAS